MKNKVLFILFCLLHSIAVDAQTPATGDYRSVSNGNWSSTAVWQVRDASGNWATPVSLPTSSNNVYIQKNHTITVDVSSAYCNDLHLNISGVLNIGANILAVSGKLRADSMSAAGIAVVGATDGSLYTDNANYSTLNATMLVSSGTGALKFVGATRNLNVSGEWNSNGTGNVSVIFALDPGAIGTVGAGFKAKTITIQSGTISTTQFMSAGAVGTGTVFTIKNGAKFSTTRSGLTNSAIGFSSSKKCDNISIESGGILEFNSSTPTVDCASITNNGTVIYLGSAGSLVTPSTNGVTDGAVNITSYKNLTLGGSGAKSIPSGLNITVSDTLKLEGTSSCLLSSVSGSSLTYGVNATLVYNISTSSTTLAASVLEWPVLNGPKNIEFRKNTVTYTASTPGASRTISGSLYFTGGSFTVNTGDSLIMSNNSSLIRKSITGGLNVSGVYVIGSVTTDQITISIDTSSTVTETKELQPTVTNGKLNLTITSGTTYIAGARSVYHFNNSGVFIMNASGFIINGDILGSGTITGNTTYSLTIQGSWPGPTTSTLNFTSGSANLFDFTINRTGTGASVRMGTNLTVARDLFLTAGILDDNGKTVSVSRNLSYNSGVVGTGTHISGTGGKIVMLANNAATANYIGSTSLGNVEINYTNLTKSLRAATTFTPENFTFAQPNTKFNLLGYVVTIKKDLIGAGLDSFVNTIGTGAGFLPNSRLILSGSSNIISGVTVMDTLEIAAGANIASNTGFSAKKIILNGSFNDGGNTIIDLGDLVGSGLHTGSGKISMQGASKSIIGGTRINNLEIATGASISPTPPALGCNAFISGILTMNGGNIGIDTGNVLTMKNGSTIYRTSGNLNLNGGSIAIGETTTDSVAVIINSSLLSSNELPGLTTGKIDLTINDGFSYTIKSNDKRVRNLYLNNGHLLSSFDTLTRRGYNLTVSNLASVSGDFYLDSTQYDYVGNTSGPFYASPTLIMDGNSSLKFGNVNNKTLYANGLLILKSQKTGTASVADVTNAGLNNGNKIAGSVVVERYISNVRNLVSDSDTTLKSWRLLSMPTRHDAQTIKESWQEGGSNNSNPLPGYGTQITSNRSTWDADGFDTLSPAPSLKFYDPSIANYTGITTTNSNFEIGKAYMLFIRGSRAKTSINQTPDVTVLREKGSIITGDTLLQIGTSGDQFVAVGNLYPSAVDYQSLVKTNLTPYLYLYDPRLATYGAFQTIAPDGTAVPGGGSYSFGNTYLQSSQGFFVKTASSGPGSILFKETAKVQGSGMTSRIQAVPQVSLRVNLKRNTGGQTLLVDGIMHVFDSSFNELHDEYDASKFFNQNENIAVKSSSNSLSIDARPFPTLDDTLHYLFSQMRTANYQLEILPQNLMLDHIQAYLEDTYLQSNSPLNLQSANYYDFAVNNDSASYAAGRFRIVFRPTITLPLSFLDIDAKKTDAKKVVVSWHVTNEQNVLSYHVEHSSDGVAFTHKSETLPVNDNHANSYTFNDEQPLSGINYYRVAAYHSDGTVKYSKVVRLTLISSEHTFSVSPNPIVNGTAQIFLSSIPSGIYSIDLIDLSGKIVFHSTLFHDGVDGNQILKIPNSVPSGIYQMRVMNNVLVRICNISLNQN